MSVLADGRAAHVEPNKALLPRNYSGGYPYKRELKHAIGDVATDDRKGREGANPSPTSRRVDMLRTLSRRRSVDDGFTPSRPLRSPGSHITKFLLQPQNVPPKFAPMRVPPPE
jgi:hypothetical protein